MKQSVALELNLETRCRIFNNFNALELNNAKDAQKVIEKIFVYLFDISTIEYLDKEASDIGFVVQMLDGNCIFLHMCSCTDEDSYLKAADFFKKKKFVGTLLENNIENTKTATKYNMQMTYIKMSKGILPDQYCFS